MLLYVSLNHLIYFQFHLNLHWRLLIFSAFCCILCCLCPPSIYLHPQSSSTFQLPPPSVYSLLLKCPPLLPSPHCMFFMAPLSLLHLLCPHVTRSLFLSLVFFPFCPSFLFSISVILSLPLLSATSIFPFSFSTPLGCPSMSFFQISFSPSAVFLPQLSASPPSFLQLHVVLSSPSLPLLPFSSEFQASGNKISETGRNEEKIKQEKGIFLLRTSL